MTVQDLPAVNASLNGITTVFLLLGFYFIKRENKVAHRKCMIAALVTSILFLTCYLTYHFNVVAVTRFMKPQWFRPYYLALLLSHTVLAVVIVPMVITTFMHAFKGNFEKHKRIARWTWPLWIYVSFTGVLIYLLLYQIFPQH